MAMRKTSVSVRQWRVPGEERGGPLLDFLARHLEVSRREAKRLLDRHVVFVNDRRVWMAQHALRGGDRVEVAVSPAPAESESRFQPVVLYRDDRYLIIDKPAGIVSTGPGSVELRLREALGQPALRCVHRLDRDTSGCLLCALDADAFARVVALFEQRALTKVYHAVVAGSFRKGQITLQHAIDGQPAVSHVQCLHAGRAASLVSVRIETGRTHQVRKHLAACGHPVLGDKQYATQPVEHAGLRHIPRQMLHATALVFTHPFDGKTVRSRSQPPRDFQQTLARLGLARESGD